MPILTFQLALVLVSCFVTGALVTWVLQARRSNGASTEDANSAWRSSNSRFEGLSQDVHRIAERLDSMEKSLQQQVHGSNAELEQTLKLRSSNPELWEIERAHHRALSEQTSQNAKLTLRIAELMDQLETVEVSARMVSGEYENLKARHENTVANYGENDRAAAAKIERLEVALRNAEPYVTRCEELQRQLESANAEWAARQNASTHEIERLRANVTRLELGEERVKQLESLAARNEQELTASRQRVQTLESELAQSISRAKTLETQCTNLELERDAAQKSLGESQTQLEIARTASSNVQSTLAKERLEHETRWNEAQSELTKTRDSLETERRQALENAKKLETALQASQAQLALSRAKLDHHSTHVEQAWSVLSELKPMLESLEQKLKETDETPAAGTESKFDLSMLDEKNG